MRLDIALCVRRLRETDVAYRWFISYGFSEKIPHFSTFSKNVEHRFRNIDLFCQRSENPQLFMS